MSDPIFIPGCNRVHGCDCAAQARLEGKEGFVKHLTCPHYNEPAPPPPADVVFGSTKTYAASVGLSAAFRQHPADSHCNQLHGYALEVIATFEAFDLDGRNWVMDFGGLKSFKQWLEQMFDHTVVIAADDPMLGAFEMLSKARIIELRVVEATGCEAMALLIFQWLETWLLATNQSPRVRVEKLEVREHAGNSAYVRRKRTGE